MYGFDITIRLATLRQEELLHTAGRRSTRTAARGLGRRAHRARRSAFPGRLV